MEKCCYSIFDDYDLIKIEEYTRVYIGDELCDNSFIYNMEKLEEIIQTYIKRKNISIVLPVLNECLFNKAEMWLEKLRNIYNNNFEVICNDIGSLSHFGKWGYNVVIGRVLTRTMMQYLISEETEDILDHKGLRIELDATNLKKVRYLRRYKRTFYNLYSLYGLANNRCAFRYNGISCKIECEKQNISLHNTYLDDAYFVMKNGILHKEKNVNVSILFDRVVDIYE